MIKNDSSCYCPENCNSIWYTHTISSGNGPNPVAEFPSSLLKRQKFMKLSNSDFRVYAKSVLQFKIIWKLLKFTYLHFVLTKKQYNQAECLLQDYNRIVLHNGSAYHMDRFHLWAQINWKCFIASIFYFKDYLHNSSHWGSFGIGFWLQYSFSSRATVFCVLSLAVLLVSVEEASVTAKWKYWQ